MDKIQPGSIQYIVTGEDFISQEGIDKEFLSNEIYPFRRGRKQSQETR